MKTKKNRVCIHVEAMEMKKEPYYDDNTPVVMCHKQGTAAEFSKNKNIWQINEDEVCNVCIKKL